MNFNLGNMIFSRRLKNATFRLPYLKPVRKRAEVL